MEQNIEQQVTRGLNQNIQNPQPQPQSKRNFEFLTETISLPSKGLGYPENSPLASGEIEIKLMTAREEDILASTNLIRKGTVLDKLLEAVVVQDGVKAEDLLTGDKNAILIATRILSYGPEYKVKITDPLTDEQVDYEIDMSLLKTKEIDFSKLNRNNEYEYTTNRGNKIVFQLLTHSLEKKIDTDLLAMSKVLKDNPVEITTRLRHIIKSVDGNTDIGYINKFITNKFLAKDSREFRNYVKDLTPDVDFEFEYISPITGEKEALQVPFGLDFFYPSN